MSTLQQCKKVLTGKCNGYQVILLYLHFLLVGSLQPVVNVQPLIIVNYVAPQNLYGTSHTKVHSIPRYIASEPACYNHWTTKLMSLNRM